MLVMAKNVIVDIFIWKPFCKLIEARPQTVRRSSILVARCIARVSYKNVCVLFKRKYFWLSSQYWMLYEHTRTALDSIAAMWNNVIQCKSVCVQVNINIVYRIKYVPFIIAHITWGQHGKNCRIRTSST